MKFLRKRPVALILSAVITLLSLFYMLGADDAAAEDSTPVAVTSPNSPVADSNLGEPAGARATLPFSSLLLSFDADISYTIEDQQNISFHFPSHGVMLFSRITGMGPAPTIHDVDFAFDSAMEAFFADFSRISFGPIEEFTVHGRPAFLQIAHGFDEQDISVDFSIAAFFLTSNHFSYLGVLVSPAENFEENYALVEGFWDNISFLDLDLSDATSLSDRMVTLMFSNFRLSLSEDIAQESTPWNLDLDFNQDRLAILLFGPPGELVFANAPRFSNNFTQEERIAYLYDLARASGDVFASISYGSVEMITINGQTAYQIHVSRYRSDGGRDPIRDRQTVLGLFEINGVFYEFIFNTEYEIFDTYYPHFQAILASISAL